MKKFSIMILATVALTGCQLPSTGNNQPLEKWRNYLPEKVSTENLGANQGMVVFYRQADITGPAVNIYVNGDYQTSLLNNGFSPVILCADRNLISSSFSSNKGAGNRINGVKFVSPSHQVTYIKIRQSSNGSLMFERTEPEQGIEDIKSLQMQAQTVSRVSSSSCNQTEYILDAKLLNANATFPLDKHSYKDVLPEGKRNVREFAEKIKIFHPQAISKIEVNGYTDPVGSDSYNQKLSERRADAIKETLINEGVKLPIKATGFGESELLVKDCEVEYRKNIAAKTQCNLPNRRVEIIVYGSEL
ncbi:OmpA family protein [Testudinibacter aquarius]|uniref:OOP family OmpA-OmpF porin n=1 Tax=Testudinibacter aquarius TaxID=1524974 RepID=A0A4R3YFH8_9PAST|nr:OmpA family protein [Testudinibacter aquarius]KAE9527425.1 hypothetical protein A1D24_01950 [Testudinibacter aquarius]TCV89948.1 OOP family OmpA-OmpF porin [Testudinibacter aquarius]TNG92214.1 hypothetical protein FHQ21_05050 [Testudinibacter aquarius]